VFIVACKHVQHLLHSEPEANNNWRVSLRNTASRSFLCQRGFCFGRL